MYFSHQIINIIQFKCKFSSIFTNVFLIYFFLSKLFSYMCNKKKGSITQPERQRFGDWYMIVPLIMDLFMLCQPFGRSPFCTLLIFLLENGFQFFPFTPEIKIYPGIEGFQYLPKCTYIVNLSMLWEEKWFSIFVTSEKNSLTSKCNRNNTLIKKSSGERKSI